MTPEDALKETNVQAFLKSIRLGEGTLDEGGYHRIVGGGLFEDFSKHPNQRIYIPKYKVWSTAAGAYQIIYPTWVSLNKMHKFTDFSPKNQDLAAVLLIRGRKALDEIIQGDFYTAITKCAPEWASLPGSKAGQRIENLDKIKKVYVSNGGVIKNETV